MCSKIISRQNSLNQINRILRAIKTKVEVNNHKIHKANHHLLILAAQIQHNRVTPQALLQIIPLAVPLVVLLAIHHPVIQLQAILHQPYHLEVIDSCKILHIFKMIQ